MWGPGTWIYFPLCEEASSRYVCVSLEELILWRLLIFCSLDFSATPWTKTVSNGLVQSRNEFTGFADLRSTSFQASTVQYGGPTWLQAINNLLSGVIKNKNKNKPLSEETCKISGKHDAVFTP